MSLQTFTRVKNYTKYGLLLAAILFFTRDLFAWDIDLSRRQNDLRRREASIPVDSKVEVKAPTFIETIFPAGVSQDIVILNTEKGFVPASIEVRKGGKYTFHIVNVNEKDKNVSFILDSFAQHFGTFYGVTKTFVIEPKKEGVYSYVSPEVAAEGRIVVVSPSNQPTTAPVVPTNGSSPSIRSPASQD